jgi:hypothetical protein
MVYNQSHHPRRCVCAGHRLVQLMRAPSGALSWQNSHSLYPAESRAGSQQVSQNCRHVCKAPPGEFVANVQREPMIIKNKLTSNSPQLIGQQSFVNLGAHFLSSGQFTLSSEFSVPSDQPLRDVFANTTDFFAK